MLAITFQRVAKSSDVEGFDATTDGSLTYDSNLTVPRAIREETLMRTQTVSGGLQMGAYGEVRTTLNLNLLDDSMAKVP